MAEERDIPAPACKRCGHETRPRGWYKSALHGALPMWECTACGCRGRHSDTVLSFAHRKTVGENKRSTPQGPSCLRCNGLTYRHGYVKGSPSYRCQSCGYQSRMDGVDGRRNNPGRPRKAQP
jgi:Zn ribbon nucleic-acid-binding protein